MENEINIKTLQKDLLNFLEDLKKTESKLWGITLNQLVSGEEEILEDTNHLIYKLQNSSHFELTNFLKDKDFEEFNKALKNLKEDFSVLKKKVNEQNKLKNLITSYTLKLVDKKTYPKLEEIFLLEKQLQEILESQENGFEKILKDINIIKLKENEIQKEDVFMQTLKDIRKLLAGHLDHHSLWEEERQGFSNTSNILNSLTKLIKESF